MSDLKKILVLIIWVIGIWPGIASAWWNKSWSYRVPIYLDTSVTGAAINSTQSNVPVLIKLHSGNFKDFFLLKEDLSDLRFIGGDDKTPLDFHVESFDFINQLIFIWVKVPQITGALNTEKIWMYYGNDAAADASNEHGTYDVNMVMVHHFKAGEHLLNDATAYKNRFTSSSGVAEPVSIIGNGMRFTGTGGVELPGSTSVKLVAKKGITISFWVKPDTDSSAVLFVQRDGKNEIKLVSNADKLTAQITLDSGKKFITSAADGYTPGVWHDIAVTVSKNKLTLYMNGIEVNSVNINAPNMAGKIIFASDVDGKEPFKGLMDEIQYSNIVRPADYLLLAAKNQGIENKLLKVGDAEQLGNTSSGESHFAFVMNKLTFDAKIVIAVLLVMSLICWIVMLMKGAYLWRLVKDNKKFLQAYSTLGTNDPAMLDHDKTDKEKALEDSPIAQALFGGHDHFQSSPIYHMYHCGVKEVTWRVGSTLGSQVTSMSKQSTDAIRAAMSADMVREMQKVNSKMVLLTIAIAGGPFIGLLGTVIGVMITFADMAASGEVNIASIAPGMAAALMATVTGLWVAIPALFGYNYLSSIIKNINADIHIFIDEFVTRVAEYHA